MRRIVIMDDAFARSAIYASIMECSQFHAIGVVTSLIRNTQVAGMEGATAVGIYGLCDLVGSGEPVDKVIDALLEAGIIEANQKLAPNVYNYVVHVESMAEELRLILQGVDDAKG